MGVPIAPQHVGSCCCGGMLGRVPRAAALRQARDDLQGQPGSAKNRMFPPWPGQQRHLAALVPQPAPDRCAVAVLLWLLQTVLHLRSRQPSRMKGQIRLGLVTGVSSWRGTHARTIAGTTRAQVLP